MDSRHSSITTHRWCRWDQPSTVGVIGYWSRTPPIKTPHAGCYLEVLRDQLGVFTEQILLPLTFRSPFIVTHLIGVYFMFYQKKKCLPEAGVISSLTLPSFCSVRFTHSVVTLFFGFLLNQVCRAFLRCVSHLCGGSPSDQTTFR